MPIQILHETGRDLTCKEHLELLQTRLKEARHHLHLVVTLADRHAKEAHMMLCTIFVDSVADWFMVKGGEGEITWFDILSDRRMAYAHVLNKQSQFLAVYRDPIGSDGRQWTPGSVSMASLRLQQTWRGSKKNMYVLPMPEPPDDPGEIEVFKQKIGVLERKVEGVIEVTKPCGPCSTRAPSNFDGSTCQYIAGRKPGEFLSYEAFRSRYG